eukprot:Plantae.Rhodophyta-Hildenbrandia_rubra.ctg1143.p1 GENE.Plantae.Rhodophyta-Hildenbrandia_rubra.ctg1143~~Plantae.Rhodophyta-Hildenbrandia_rubra.ctg1143.p1  ORF type:complete len:172 (+),score=21.12 Plantae.Rhodophyta-Hildenbrandia_rubra.ctg1143:41-517(+)
MSFAGQVRGIVTVDPKHPPSFDTGSQESKRRWKTAVQRWEMFQDDWVENGNTSGLKQKSRGLALLRALHGEAADLCQNISDEELRSDKGVDIIVSRVLQLSPDTDMQYNSEILDNLATLYRKEGQKIKEFTSLYKIQLEKYQAVNGKNVTRHDPVSCS